MQKFPYDILIRKIINQQEYRTITLTNAVLLQILRFNEMW